MTELLKRVEALCKDDGLGGNGSSSGELLLLEVVEEFITLLLGFVGEKEDTVAFKILGKKGCTSAMW